MTSNYHNGSRSQLIDAAIAEYLEALEQGTTPEREAFLAKHVGIADELRAFLADYSALRQEAPREPAQTSDSVSSVAAGATVGGRYRLLQLIGEGGMGTVWMAEQRAPVKRLVALKMIKPGMASKAVLARFDAERQALALMDHPNIAKVLDGAAAEDGRPYFVMELVKGIPPTQYCDARRLSISERLDLFVQICQAVQHVHQKGIIHRDIKPTNILVTEHDGRPVPKVIDFGLAKALQGTHALTEQTLYTGFGAMVGTPLYMAPEQVGINALDVDTRSDIYSLGVLLYELLTGQTPYDSERLKEAGFDEVRRIIREEDPPRPSTRLSKLAQQAIGTVAEKRSSDARQLSRLFEGEIDWIVMKALDKDRSCRYDTASALAADVERYLRNEPLHACPPSAIYRFRKFLYRYRAAMLTASSLLFALTLGAIVSTWQFLRATNAELCAKANAELASALNQRAEVVSRFIVDAFRNPDPDKAPNIFAHMIDLLADGPQPDDLGETVCCQLAQWDAGFDRVAKLRPNEPVLWIGHAQNRVLRGRWAEAAADYARVIFARPLSDNWDEYAYLLVLQGDMGAYHQLCQQLIARHGEPKDDRAAFVTARAFAAAPCDSVEPSRLVKWALQGVSTGQEYSRSQPWFLHVLGLAHYRAGQFQAAIESLTESNDLPWNRHQKQLPKAQNWLVLAMAHYRLGHTAEAQKCLMMARGMMDQMRPENTDEMVNMDACDWLPMLVLLREAEALLQPRSAKAASIGRGSNLGRFSMKRYRQSCMQCALAGL